MYNNLVFKVQSLENKINKIVKRSGDIHGSNPIYFSNKSRHYESIRNLLELAKSIKHELQYALKCSPENKHNLKMYNNLCTLESELLNLFTCIQPFKKSNVKQKIRGSKDSFQVLREIPEVRCDYFEDLPKSYSKQYKSFVTQELRKKVSSNRCCGNITDPEYIVTRKNSSDSFGASSYYYRSSGSSSSTVTIDNNIKSKSSYQDPPSSMRVGRRTPERIPVFINKSRGLSRRKKDKRKRHKPTLKKSPLQFGLRKSDSNKINVHANDLQTQETEVFLIKKKKKPRLRELSGENSSSERYFISRLKKVLSSRSKSRPLDSNRNKPPKHGKSSTTELREKNYYVNKRDKKGLQISKYKENDYGLQYSSPKYSEDSLYGEEKTKKKPYKKRLRSKKYVESRSHNSKPVAAARSSSLNNNPFYDENHIFYLQGSSFVLLPTKLSSRDKRFSRNHVNDKPYSNYVNESRNGSFNKPVRTSNHTKKSSFSNTDSTYEILVSNKNYSNLYPKENDYPLCIYKTNGHNSCSKYMIPLSKTYESLHESGGHGRIKKYDSKDNNGKYDDYNSSSCQHNAKSNSKLILLKEGNNSIPVQLLDNKEISFIKSRMNVNNKGKNISLNERPTLENENGFHNNPFGVSITAPSIYLATIPQTLDQNGLQNPPTLNDTNQHKVKDSNYTMNSTFDTYQNKESPTSLDISNLNHTASPPLNSSPSGRSMNVINKLHTSSKSGSKIFPFKNVSRDTKNSHSETKGNIVPLENTKSQSRGSSLATVQPTSRYESHIDDSRSVGSNQSPTSKKSKKWLPRSLSKLSIMSKRSKKTKAEKDKKSVTEEASENDLPDQHKQVSTEKQRSSDKVSKPKSWTSLKRTMSGVGSLKKLSKAKKTEKRATLQKVKSENKLGKQPSLLKRMFSKSKTQLSDDTIAGISSTGPISTTGYEGDKTSLTSLPSLISHSPKSIKNSEHLESKKLHGYQVASKLSKKKQPLLTSSPVKNKKQTLKDNPKPFNYSLHYSKEKHKCVETDLVPSMLCLIKSCPPAKVKTCGSKNLWSRCETVLSEHELSEFEKHNKYHEFFFKPNKCQGCTVHNKKVSKVCQKRGEEKYLNGEPLNSVRNDDNDHLSSDPKSYVKSIPITTSEPFLSDSSDICDWKKIANEIKECQ